MRLESECSCCSRRGRVPAQTPQPATPDFLVNVYTTGNQGPSRIAVEPDGDFVVVWDERRPGRQRLRGVRHAVSPRAAPRAGPSSASTPTRPATQNLPTWRSAQTERSSSCGPACRTARARASRGSGTTVPATRWVAEFQVNYVYDVLSVRAPRGPGRGWAVRGELGELPARTATCSGSRPVASTPRATPWEATSSSTRSRPTGSPTAHVASDANGNFVVVWRDQAPGRDGSGWGVFGQRFDAAGNRARRRLPGQHATRPATSSSPPSACRPAAVSWSSSEAGAGTGASTR